MLLPFSTWPDIAAIDKLPEIKRRTRISIAYTAGELRNDGAEGRL